MGNPEADRLNSEWLALSAVRELMSFATTSGQKATYKQAMELGRQIVPDLLGDDVSLIRKSWESDTAREFRQKAIARNAADESDVTALELLDADISEYKRLVAASKSVQNAGALKARLTRLESAREEIAPQPHSENQLIFRDVYNIERELPEIFKGRGYRDFENGEGQALRIRVLHPEPTEHVTGADLIYERHDITRGEASVLAVQYKIWKDGKLYLTDQRIGDQLNRMKNFICDSRLCDNHASGNDYRFPYCAAFLRPTDHMQVADQRLMSSGEHLPICKIDSIRKETRGGAGKVLHRDDVRECSLSHELFEPLFRRGKIGSGPVTYDRLANLYESFSVIESDGSIMIHVQEFAYDSRSQR